MEDALEEQAEEIISMLRMLGLGHVPVMKAESYLAEADKVSELSSPTLAPAPTTGEVFSDPTGQFGES